MHSKSPYKLFSCLRHPTEIIQGILSDDDTIPDLKCLKCLLEDTGTFEKSKMLTIDEYMTMACKYYEILKNAKTIDDDIANQIIIFLRTEKEALDAFSNHISREKLKVNESLNTILQDFLS
jgi:hypothetical protein